jgi:L-ascorbate metabolism protein UlaG (beta-lactamase superfamily)
MGHATVLLELDGVRLLTDPLLRQRVGHLRRRSERIELDSLGDLDAVLISHSHHDHLDLPSLRMLDRDIRLIVAPDVAPLVAKLGFEQVTVLAQGEATQLGPVRVSATAAEHGGRRGLFGPRLDAVGFLCEAGDTRTYFAGDTDLFDEMRELAPLDLALLPVWGWGPSLGGGHLDPKGAAEALELLRPRVAVPIHWGTLYPIGPSRLRDFLLHEPPRAFARHAARHTPEVEVRIVEPGGSTNLAR